MQFFFLTALIAYKGLKEELCFYPQFNILQYLAMTILQMIQFHCCNLRLCVPVIAGLVATSAAFLSHSRDQSPILHHWADPTLLCCVLWAEQHVCVCVIMKCSSTN